MPVRTPKAIQPTTAFASEVSYEEKVSQDQPEGIRVIELSTLNYLEPITDKVIHRP